MLKGGARQVKADYNRFSVKERIERAATHEAHTSLARELHDGILQSLAGAKLQLDALARLIDANDQEAAHKLLRSVEDLLTEEQQKLRIWVQRHRSPPFAAAASSEELFRALRVLCKRGELRWNLRISLDVGDSASVPRALGDEIYRIVQEGLNNIGQHAHAHTGRVEMRMLFDSVLIVLVDDGIGFPFLGHYDLGKLAAERVGPRSLAERVASLRGQLTLTSTPKGSRIEVNLPLHRDPGSAWGMSGADIVNPVPR